jgi:hypothetical protein
MLSKYVSVYETKKKQHIGTVRKSQNFCSLAACFCCRRLCSQNMKSFILSAAVRKLTLQNVVSYFNFCFLECEERNEKVFEITFAPYFFLETDFCFMLVGEFRHRKSLKDLPDAIDF